MSREIDVSKSYDELSSEDQAYLDARQYLKDAHDQAHRQHVASEGAEDDVPDVDDADDEEPVDPEEWVRKASKSEIMEELDNRGVEYDPKARKDDLGNLLLQHIQ